MTPLDLLNITLGIGAAVGAVLAARKMVPGRVYYLGRVPSRPGTEPPENVVAAGGPIGEGFASGRAKVWATYSCVSPEHVDVTAHAHTKRVFFVENWKEWESEQRENPSGPGAAPEQLGTVRIHGRRLDEMEKRLRRLEERSSPPPWEEDIDVLPARAATTKSVN